MIAIVEFIRNKCSRLFGRYLAECGTVVDKMPGTVEVPEGYELPKFNPKTGRAEYSDGTIAEHIELRKIN